MGKASFGQGNQSDNNENEVGKNTPSEKTFGEEGTNKTRPKPDPHAKPAGAGVGGKFIEPSPFNR